MGAAEGVGPIPTLNHALQQSRLGDSANTGLIYKTQISPVNCENLQFTGELLPRAGCAKEPWGSQGLHLASFML